MMSASVIGATSKSSASVPSHSSITSELELKLVFLGRLYHQSAAFTLPFSDFRSFIFGIITPAILNMLFSLHFSVIQHHCVSELKVSNILQASFQFTSTSDDVKSTSCPGWWLP